MTQAVVQVRNIVARSGFANPLTLEVLVTDEDYVKVYADDELLDNGPDYEITGIGDPNGVSIEIIGAEDVDNYVGVLNFVALYDPPLDQQGDLSAGGVLGRNFERALDQQNRRLQALADRVYRSMKLSVNIDGDIVLTPVDGGVPVWNEAEQRFDFYELSSTASLADALPLIGGTMTGPIGFTHQASPANPAAGVLALFAKSDNKFYSRTAGGVETEIGAAGGAAVVADRTELKALDTTTDTVALLTEGGRAGTFVWSVGDYSAQVTLDAGEGVYVKADAIASSAGAWVRIVARSVNPRWFGALGDNATNDTAAMNRAFAVAYDLGLPLYLPGGFIFRVDESSPGSTYALLNEGVPVFGDGKNQSIIAPMSTMPSTASFMRIRPNGNCDFLFLRDFLIYANVDGTAKGKYGIHVLGDQATNMTGFEMDGVYIAPTTDYSLRMENNGALNVQGVPANTRIERCAFWEGVNATFVGDSIIFRGNVLRATSTRVGVRLYNTDGSGVAGTFVFENNNVDCAGGAFLIIRGKSVKILRNNIDVDHRAV